MPSRNGKGSPSGTPAAVRPPAIREDDAGALHWAAFEGIPLCHVAGSPEEAARLQAKGVCGPRC